MDIIFKIFHGKKVNMFLNFFYFAQAIVNEDASGDVIALRREIQQLKVLHALDFLTIRPSIYISSLLQYGLQVPGSKVLVALSIAQIS